MNSLVTKPGRNDPCPCGSGKRYKHCCGVVHAAGPVRPAAPRNIAAGSSSLAPQELGALVAMIDQGRLAQAEERALALLKGHPGTGMVWKILSVALVRQGKNALPALSKAAQLMPLDAEVHGNLGSALLAAGQPADALASLTRALELRPNDAEALLEAGDATQALGRPQEAIALYQRAVALDARSPLALNNLGNALLRLGRRDEAVSYYRLALERRPQNAQVLCNLADALRQADALEEAVSLSERAIRLEPSLARAHNVLGLSLGGLGERERAATSLRQAVTLDPRSQEAVTNLANVLRDLGARREALALYRKAVELDPQRPEGHCGLGNAEFELRHLTAAAESFRRAIALRPDYGAAHVGLAATLRIGGQAREAEASCRAGLAAAPEDPEALVLLGELRADRGYFDEAQQLFGRAIHNDPHCVSAFCSIAAHRRMTGADGAWLTGVQQLLERPLPLAQATGLRFALGKYFDDVGAYAEAFRCYREGNELTRRSGAAYDGDKLAARIDRLIERFDAPFVRALHSFAQQHGAASSSERPVFIVGMPRSGTSLAEQILASHSQVYGAGEVRFWDDAFATLEKSGLETAATAAGLAEIARAYLARLTAVPPEASRAVDKMPANFLYAGLIHAALPRARIIHMRRHPLDTCLSIYFQNFFNVSPFASDLESLAHYYAQYLRITEHWRSVLPATALLEVPYEALVTDQETWTRRMLEFIALPWDARCLDFHRTERVVITASRWQVRQRIHASSVGRWRNYEQYLGPLGRLANRLPAQT